MTRKENLFADVPSEEREARIMAMAVKSEYEQVKRPYSEDEKIQLKDFVVTESTQVMKQTKEFKAIKKEFDSAIKSYKESITDALTTLHRGYTQNEEKLYFIDDQENGFMDVYDKNGEHQYSRKLLPGEKQARMVALKTGTED